MGGIPLQIQDGVTGYLVASIEETIARALELLRHPEQSEALGDRGHEEVRQKFLSTAHLRNYLTLFNDLAHLSAPYSIASWLAGSHADGIPADVAAAPGRREHARQCVRHCLSAPCT